MERSLICRWTERPAWPLRRRPVRPRYGWFASRRLIGLPKGLAPDQVRRLSASCDDTTRRGCRDIAILTVLVRLGMRAGELAKLQLDDIDWRVGEIIVRGKGTLSNASHKP